MICACTPRDHAARFFWRDNDRLPDLVRARRSRFHRHIGGFLVTADIIQFIPRPKRNDVQTDFPAIVFRFARQDPAAGPVDAAPERRPGSANREA